MTFRLFFSFLLVAFLFTSCKKDDGGTPPEPPGEDFSFPASNDTALVLHSGATTIGVNQTFDVKVICYNVAATFGAAFEVGFTNTTVEVQSVIVGPFIGPAAQTVQVTQIENANSRVSFGISYLRNAGLLSTGSGVVFKIRCRTKAGGTAQFTINTTKVELKKADGTPIDNFSRVQYLNLSMTVQ